MSEGLRMGGGVYIGDLGDEVYLLWGTHKVIAKQAFRTCNTNSHQR